MNVSKRLKKFLRSSEAIVLLILILVMFTFTMLSPTFLTVRNMFDLLRIMIVTGIFVCGVMVVIISGGIDMSFMAIAICSAYITIRFSIANAPDLPFIVLALMSMAIGTLFGFMPSIWQRIIFLSILKMP